MTKLPALLFLSLLCISGQGAWAQSGPGTAAPFENGPDSALAEVPPNGCVWGNLIYSNGAVIERPLTNRVYFRCVQGSWMNFPTLEQATTYGLPRPGAAAPR